MTSEVEGFNIALGLLGQQSVQTLDPSSSAMSVAVRKLYTFRPIALDMVLAEHDWLEARQPVMLNPLSLSGVIAPWNYAYALPPDFLRMAEVSSCDSWAIGTQLDDNNARRQVIFAKSLLTEASCIVRLSWDLLSPHMAMMAATQLAILGCMNVTNDKMLKQKLQSDYADLRATAMNIEAFNSADDPPFENLGAYRNQAL